MDQSSEPGRSLSTESKACNYDNDPVKDTQMNSDANISQSGKMEDNRKSVNIKSCNPRDCFQKVVDDYRNDSKRCLYGVTHEQKYYILDMNEKCVNKCPQNIFYNVRNCVRKFDSVLNDPEYQSVLKYFTRKFVSLDKT